MAAKPIDMAPAGVQSLRMDAKGHRVHYLKAGSGPPVVLVHGGASDSRDWLGTIAGLAHRFTLYAPDLIGFGRSERKGPGYYLSDFIEFIEEFIGRLGLAKPALVGHSFGGRICAGAALRNPAAVRKLVLIEAAGLGRVTGFGSMLMTTFRAVRRMLRRPQPYPRFLAKDGDEPHWLCAHELPALEMPTLIIWKRYDPYLPVSLARQAAQTIPGARLEIVKGFGHAPHQQNSEAVTRLLLDFLGNG